MFLIDGLLHSVEGYSDGDLGASAYGGLQAKSAAKLACTLFHHRNAEVSTSRRRSIGRIEPATVIADRKVKGVTFILEVDGDGGGLGMANSVRYRLLTDADKVMDAAWCKRYLVSFDVERGSNYFLHVICGQRAG